MLSTYAHDILKKFKTTTSDSKKENEKACAAKNKKRL